MSETRAHPKTAAGAATPLIRLLVITAARETRLFATTQTDEVTADVALFIEQQIGLLPKILGIAVRLAIRIFNLEPIMFHGKTFTRLSQTARGEHMKRWESSRFAAKRDLIRYIRSLVLFNYYDHPDVRSRI